MAKKVVATLKTGAGKAHTKCIKMVKPKRPEPTPSKTEVVLNDQIKDFSQKISDFSVLLQKAS